MKASRIRSRTAATDDEAAAEPVVPVQLPTPEECMKQTFFFQDQS